jgi:hypothetical protein
MRTCQGNKKTVRYQEKLVPLILGRRGDNPRVRVMQRSTNGRGKAQTGAASEGKIMGVKKRKILVF